MAQASQLISNVFLIFFYLVLFGSWIDLVVSGNPSDILVYQNHHQARPAMILPLYHSTPNVSSNNTRRHLKRSESKLPPNAHMRLYDDLLLNG